jgi:hypothetical protein
MNPQSPLEWRSLFRGAVRESMAAAHSVAKIGTQDTRAWERPIRYVADDNDGNVGVIEFITDGAVAAISARAPGRLFDLSKAIATAPSALRGMLSNVCDLPLLQEGQGVSAVFWTAGAHVLGPEAWSEICLFGADLFRREFLPDSAWTTEGAVHYELAPDIARLAIAISNRATPRVPLVDLSEEELRRLIPNDSEYKSEALELLASDGLFGVG